MNRFSVLAVYLAVVVAGVYGWVENIVQLAHAHEVTGLVVLRAAGIVIGPLGAVLGYV